MIAHRAIDRPCTFLNERARIVTTQSTVPVAAKRTIVWRWRVVDIVVAAVIGVAAGVVFWAFGLAYSIPGDALGAILVAAGAGFVVACRRRTASFSAVRIVRCTW